MQLKTRGDINGMLKAGEVEAALKLLSELNEWTKCLDIAAERRHPMLLQLLEKRVEVIRSLHDTSQLANWRHIPKDVDTAPWRA